MQVTFATIQNLACSIAQWCLLTTAFTDTQHTAAQAMDAASQLRHIWQHRQLVFGLVLQNPDCLIP